MCNKSGSFGKYAGVLNLFSLQLMQKKKKKNHCYFPSQYKIVYSDLIETHYNYRFFQLWSADQSVFNVGLYDI